jgi:nucleolar protein 53
LISKLTALSSRPNHAKKAAPCLNIWEETNADPIEGDNDFLPATKRQKPPITLSVLPDAAVYLPKVKVPSAGASYNPRYEDHQITLKEALIAEENLIAEAKLYNRKSASEGNCEANRSSADELEKSEIPLESDDSVSDPDEIQEILTKPCRRLTRTERNRQARRKKQEQMAELKKKDLKMSISLLSIDTIKQELNKRMHYISKQKGLRAQFKELKKFKPKRLSKEPFKPLNPMFQLTEDIPDSMLRVRTEGNLLADRFKSLQERNIIEVQSRSKPRRKFPLKVYEKRDYRDFE